MACRNVWVDPSRACDSGYVANDLVKGGKLSVLAIEGRRTQALVFRPSRRREAAFATGAIALAVVGGLIAIAPEQAVASRAVGLLTFALLGTVGVRRVLRLRAGGEYLALAAEGVALSTWLGSEFVLWQDIMATHLGEVAGVSQLLIRTRRSPARGLPTLVRGIDRTVYGWDFSIGPASLGLPAEALHDAIRYWLEHPSERRRITDRSSG